MGGNILDLVLTSDPARISEVDYGPPLENVKIGHAIIKLQICDISIRYRTSFFQIKNIQRNVWKLIFLFNNDFNEFISSHPLGMRWK